MATIHHIFGNSKQAQAAEFGSPTPLTRAIRDMHRRISPAEELRLLEAARAEDVRASLLRRLKELAAPELMASDSVTEKDARLKARKAAYRRARSLAASPEHLAPPQFEALIRLVLDACFRPLELLTLEWSEVNQAAGTVSLQGWKNTPTRTFRINADTLALLQRLPRTSPRVFDVSYRALSASWRSICRRSNLPPLRLSDLRHEAVCRAVESGRLQPWEVRAFLGLKPERRMRHFLPPSCVF